MKHHYIAIAGNMGSGKTTLGKLLADHLHWPFIEENVVDNPYLERFYQSPKEWSYASETYFLISKIKQLTGVKELLETQSVVGDTPIYQDVYSFAQTQHDIGHLSDRYWDAYVRMFQSVEYALPTPDLIVYLELSVDRVMERIKKRNRPYEKDITKADLQRLEDNNQHWLARMKKHLSIVHIDAGKYDVVSRESDRNIVITDITTRLSKVT